MPSTNETDTDINKQGRYWCITIPRNDWSPPSTLEEPLCWIKGQVEVGEQTGFVHWQLICALSSKQRGRRVKSLFCRSARLSLSRSEAADQYVWKDETAIIETRFEIGSKAIKLNSKTDWKKVKDLAKAGRFDELEELCPRVFISSYRTLRQISIDYQVCPDDLAQTCGIWVYGSPGVGKSYAVRQKFGESLFVKPQNKWWDGYKGEDHVLLDDFDSSVMGHFMKIWSDAYGFMAESKSCTSRKIRPKTIIVTSNYNIGDLFTDPVLAAAVSRRFKFVHMLSREDANLI